MPHYAYVVNETAFTAEKAERFGGPYWVQTRSTRDSTLLPEELCPHFLSREIAVAWIRQRVRCEWCGAPVDATHPSGFCSDEHERLHEKRYVSPRFRRIPEPRSGREIGGGE